MGSFKSGNTCHRSVLAYPELLAAQGIKGITAPVDFVACSGATTDDILSQAQDHGDGSRQLSHVDANTALVTLSAGGDDVGFPDVLKECLEAQPPAASCQADETAAGGQAGDAVDLDIKRLYYHSIKAGNRSGESGLTATFTAIKRQSNGRAAVFVIGYPQIFADPSIYNDAKSFDKACATTHRTPVQLPTYPVQDDDVRWVRERTVELNSLIALAAKQAGVHYVDTTADFQGHEECRLDPATGTSASWLNPLPSGPIARLNLIHYVYSFHPNTAGQQAFAKLLGDAGALDPAAHPNPDPPSTPDPGPGDPGPTKVVAVGNLTPTTPTDPGASQVIAGQALGYASTNWAPGGNVGYQFRSQPVDLGTFSAGPDGKQAVRLRIPLGTSPGLHLLTATGPAADGATQRLVAAVVVSASLGSSGWAWALLVVYASLILLLGAGMPLIIRRRRRAAVS